MDYRSKTILSIIHFQVSNILSFSNPHKSFRIALTKAMRIDFLKYGIKVSSVSPGAVNTEFSSVRFKGDIERANQVYHGYQPLLAEDIAASILHIVKSPSHVNINDIKIMPTAQANAYYLNKTK